MAYARTFCLCEEQGLVSGMAILDQRHSVPERPYCQLGILRPRPDRSSNPTLALVSPTRRACAQCEDNTTFLTRPVGWLPWQCYFSPVLELKSAKRTLQN